MKAFELTPEGKLKPRIFLGMESSSQILAELERCRYLTNFAHEQAMRALRGRSARIIFDWRDQPYGRSKPNLKGGQFGIESVSIGKTRVDLWLSGLRCAVPLDVVEILP